MAEFTDDEINDLIRLAQLKVRTKQFSKEISGAQARLVEAFKRLRRNKYKAIHGDESYEGILVEQEMLVLDPEALKKALPRSVWIKVTNRVLDKKKLEQAIADGVVDERVVAKCSEMKPKAPYVLTEINKVYREEG